MGGKFGEEVIMGGGKKKGENVEEGMSVLEEEGREVLRD